MPIPHQPAPLLISSILRYAARHHPTADVVSMSAAGLVHRSTYAAVERRARQAMRVLRRLGVLPGDRVTTLALPGHRHLELAYASTGMGAVLHPLDPRLPEEDLAALIDQDDDCVLFIDPAFAELAATLVPRVRHVVRRLVVLCEEAELPMIYLPVAVSLHCYESLLAADPPEEAWPVFSEDVTAVLSVSSGATGRRRGVPRSHRDVVLSALTANQPDALGLRATDRVATCAEFHQFCGWSVPFVAPMAGAALLMPAWPGDAAGLAALIARESATCLIAPPSTLDGLRRHLVAPGSGSGGRDAAATMDPLAARLRAALPSLARVVVGAAAPTAPLLEAYAAAGLAVTQGLGLTEAGAALTSTAPSFATVALGGPAAGQRAASQGRALFGVELRLVDSNGDELPWDGLAEGELQLRGPTVTPRYHGDAASAVDADGWLATGDVARIDPFGFVTLLDRVSDLIRCGGQWLSAARLEAAALDHPDIAEAACVAARHPKWTERPVLLVVPWPGHSVTEAAVLDNLRDRLPRWSLPDAVVVLAALPRTVGGRVDKLALRRQHGDLLRHRRPGGQLPTRA